MDCLQPRSVRNVKTGEGMSVRCGRCLPCRRSRASEWTIRLTEQLKVSSNNYFITLTLSDENLTWGKENPTLVRRDVQLFIKRLRKLMIEKIKFYAVGEYGEKEKRPHYHLLIFNTGIKEKIDFEWNVLRAWDKGLIHVGYVSEASIRYVAGYMEKDLFGQYKVEDIHREFNQMSKGIGEVYTKATAKYHSKTQKMEYSLGGGKFVALPRYYRNRLFTDEERKAFADRVKAEHDKLTAYDIIRQRSINENRINALNKLKNKRK